MTKMKTKTARFSVSLLDAFDKLRKQRIKNNVDSRTISDARITEALAKDVRFNMILEDFARRPGKK